MNITPEIKRTREQNIILAYKFLKDGKGVQWIEDFFTEHQNCKPITTRHYLIEARKLISTEADMDVDYSSVAHDFRYEKIWNDDKNAYLEWVHAPEEPWERAQNMEVIQRYRALLKSLKQRENLYGLRDKDLVLALHSNLTLTRDSKAESFETYVKESFDSDKLSAEEKMELLDLLKASYQGDIFDKKEYIEEPETKQVEVRAVKQNLLTTTEVIKEGFKEIKDKPKSIPKTNSKFTESIKVIDLTEKKEGKSLEDVRNILKKAIEKTVKKKYK